MFGAIGDRLGRKVTLLITVIGMGLCTAVIGLIPSNAAIDVAAPILLILMRVLQGLFVGGETGGAATMVVEHAPVGRRGLFGAFLLSGAGIANVLSAGMFAGLGAGPESFFMTWGWRIPFVFSLVLSIVAFLLYSTESTGLIWPGMVVGFVIPGVAMQSTLSTMLTEMFDVEQRTTGVNIGYQLSNTLGGGFAPMIAIALVGWASGSIWPVIIYVVAICLIGAIATASASIRPDTENAGRLHAKVAH